MSIAEVVEKAQRAQPTQDVDFQVFRAHKNELPKEWDVQYIPPFPKGIPTVAWVMTNLNRTGWTNEMVEAKAQVEEASLAELLYPTDPRTQEQLDFLRRKIRKMAMLPATVGTFYTLLFAPYRVEPLVIALPDYVEGLDVLKHSKVVFVALHTS